MALLEGFGFSGFRSFRDDLQVVGPMAKVNLIAGPNNSGKSNVLRVAQAHLVERPVTPTGLDVPREDLTSPFLLAIARKRSDMNFEEPVRGGVWNWESYKSQLERIFDHPSFRLTGDDLVWFVYSSQAPDRNVNGWGLDVSWLSEISGNARGPFREISTLLTGQSGGHETSDAARVLGYFSPLGSLPPVVTVEAFRQITAGDDADNQFYTGRGLIRGLQRLQSPTLERQDDKSRFEAVNRFLRSVLEDDSARLDIPHDAETILVHRGNLILPLDHLGTGIHQVVILAVAATLLTGTLICMEEPEVHLHPLLQRKLVRYLNDQTDNQYLIATHSAHMLDHERATVFHAKQTEGGTVLRRAGSPADVAVLCADLGYRPSDLLQTNAIIWVEGPSDRIYLRRWIELAAPDLVEGIHYSIMFYGGRLLNHLSAQDPLVEEFISLRRLNRHIAILIDSDKKMPQGGIGETKRRMKAEFNDDSYPGFAWITDGRTIENYIPLNLLKSGLSQVHPDYTLSYAGQKWDDPLAVSSSRPSHRCRVDKVRLAHAVASSWTADQLDHRDLQVRLKEVVAFIQLANH